MPGGLCLNMIVRDEARILPRCLASLAPWIAAYVVADTGSSDGTPDIIRRELRGIPGEVAEVPFEDFGQARNAALDIARASARDFTHILFCDADMALVVEDAESLRTIAAPAYAVRQRLGSNLSYANTRIVRRDVGASYVGRTHEYLRLPPGWRPPVLSGASFVDHADGSSRAVKARRDMLLLRRSIAEDPSDARAHFYLAQTQREGGMYEDAIDSYERRIVLGGSGSAEEIWYSAYMIARCHLALGREPDAVAAALRAYEMRPTRAEPLHLLARIYAERGDGASTEIFCAAGRRIPFPSEDRFFVEDEVYGHAFDEASMFSGFRSQDPEVRRRTYERCMTRSVDPNISPAERSAAVAETANVCLRATEAFGARLHRLKLEPIAPGYFPLNPSILSYGEDRVAIGVRWINYELGKPPPASVETLNEIVVGTLADSGPMMRVAVRLPFDDLAGRSAEPGVVFRDARNGGYEDCRLFMWRDGLWAVATVCDRNGAGRAEIALLDLTTGSEGVLVWETHVQRSYGAAGRHEKNWTPLVSAGGDLHLIYSVDPTVILTVDPDTFQASIRESLPPDGLSLGGLRGGSQAIPFDLDGAAGYLYAAHEVFGVAPGRRWYTHRLVWLDAALQIRHVSDPFYLYIRGVEFVAGIAEVGGAVVMSFGVEDRRAMLARAPRGNVVEWLLAPSARRAKA